MDDYKNIGS